MAKGNRGSTEFCYAGSCFFCPQQEVPDVENVYSHAFAVLLQLPQQAPLKWKPGLVSIFIFSSKDIDSYE
jgi:hypothetical protein